MLQPLPYRFLDPGAEKRSKDLIGQAPRMRCVHCAGATLYLAAGWAGLVDVGGDLTLVSAPAPKPGELIPESVAPPSGDDVTSVRRCPSSEMSPVLLGRT